jgi:hypothetical protein
MKRNKSLSVQNRTLRIFVTTSHVSTVYISLMAKETANENYIDFLFVDSGTRRIEKIEQIKLTAQFHSWKLFHNFSEEAGEILDFRPSLTKRIIRRIKEWPVLKTGYQFLLKRHMSKTDARYRNLIQNLIQEQGIDYAQVHLVMMTETYLNRPLIQLFKNANISYLEHGIGDYFYAAQSKHPGELLVVFADAFKQFLAKKNADHTWVKTLPGLNDFGSITLEIMKRQKFEIAVPNSKREKTIFILMEAVDVYEVSESFWTSYLDHIFKQLDNPQEYHYLLKPHHLQSPISMELTHQHFKRLGYTYQMLDDERIKSAAIEVLFSAYSQSVSQVFFLFSSAGFYLSELYKGEDIRYRYSLDFMLPHVQNSPVQFRKLFMELIPMMEDVFGKNCEKY